MPKIAYVDKRLSARSLAVVAQANAIIEDYAGQGFTLTLRQLYYQFVSRDLLANTPLEYKRLGSLVNDARLAGLIDWNAIEDRTRSLRGLSHWGDPSDILQSAASSYHKDLWEGQEWRPEVWIEKDALVGVIAGICSEWDVPYFSCRGYTSQSEMWRAGERLQGYLDGGQTPLILHLGDHDPSGKDMSRDIQDRLQLFMGGTEFDRLALNMDQVEQYTPPPNPAKLTDSRAEGYIAEFGYESWELDALEPRVLVDLIDRALRKVADVGAIQEVRETIEEERRIIQRAADRWPDVVRFVQ